MREGGQLAGQWRSSAAAQSTPHKAADLGSLLSLPTYKAIIISAICRGPLAYPFPTAHLSNVDRQDPSRPSLTCGEDGKIETTPQHARYSDTQHLSSSGSESTRIARFYFCRSCIHRKDVNAAHQCFAGVHLLRRRTAQDTVDPRPCSIEAIKDRDSYSGRHYGIVTLYRT